MIGLNNKSSDKDECKNSLEIICLCPQRVQRSVARNAPRGKSRSQEHAQEGALRSAAKGKVRNTMMTSYKRHGSYAQRTRRCFDRGQK